jgi:transportin-3
MESFKHALDMEQVPDMSTVYAAINTLFNVPAESHKASLWLDELRRSVHAWTVCDHILSTTPRGTDATAACHFAANTMRRKVLENFHELPATSYDQLRQSLMQHIM